MDQKIKFEGVAAMGTYKKLNCEQLMSGLDDIIHHFNNINGIEITWLHLDNEFRPLKKQLESRWDLKVNFCAPDEHVGNIERLNRTIEDRFRVKYHRMPYDVIPRPMIRHLTMSIPKKRNIFPKKHGISKHYGPQMIVNKKQWTMRNI